MTTYRAPKRRTIDDRWSAREMYPYRSADLPPKVERDVVELYPSQPFGTHGSVCADLLLHALQQDERAQRSPSAYRDDVIKRVLSTWTAGMVGRILVYSSNNRHTGRREPKTPEAQRLAFRRNLFATYPLAVAALSKTSSEPANVPAPKPTVSDPFGANTEAMAKALEAIEAEPLEPVISLPQMFVEPEPIRLGNIVIGSMDPLRAHHEWSVAVREAMVERGLSWSMRPTIDGIALIGAGCPAEGVRDACLMDYPDDLRSQLGVLEPYDFAAFGVVDYLLKAARARVDDRGKLRPVCLAMVGPAGTGKTTLASVLAAELDVARYDVSMSGGTPMSAFYGIDRLNAELTRSDFERWAVDGGIHLFDEMDCSDPNLLKIVNKALANRDYTNPLSGRRIELSPDAIALAGMNTLGVGIQAEYSAAEQLDFSTIDRFRAGRVRVDIDERLEAQIVEAQIVSIRGTA